jgi:hypothetical protein
VFKRTATVEAPTMTAYDNARVKAALAAGTTTAAVMTAMDHLAPRLDTAKESGSHALHNAREAVVPVIAAAAPAMAMVKAKGGDLLTSDAALEARNRATLMLAAAKGRPVVVQRRRWPLAAMFLALGAAIGAAVAMVTSRMATTVPPAAEESTAGPNIDLSQPLTETEPQPVNVLSDATSLDDIGDSYTEPRATF